MNSYQTINTKKLGVAVLTLSASIFALPSTSFAKTKAESPMLVPVAATDDVCLFKTEPTVKLKYAELHHVKIAKGVYGSVSELIPQLVDKVHSMNANAVIEYNGSQRFGFWPWRFVRPVVRGTAIQWEGSPSADCVAAGGILASSLTNTVALSNPESVAQ